LPSLSIEAHLIERGAPALSPFYGRTVRLHLRARLRDEERFSSVDALVAQIRRDIDSTKSILDVGW
jgi:FAD synthase